MFNLSHAKLKSGSLKYRRLSPTLPGSCSRQEPTKSRRGLLLIVLTTIAVTLFYLRILKNHTLPSKSCDGISGYTCEPSISQNWGQYSPYFSVPSELSTKVPPNCKVTLAQILSRHGARDPTEWKSMVYRELVGRIKRRTTAYIDEYAFLENYEYSLGEDQLTAFGRQELVYSGQKYYGRYKELIAEKKMFVRASDQQRVVDSAREWLLGFDMASKGSDTKGEDTDGHRIVLLPEGDGKNNTLNHGLCDAFEADYADLAEEAMSGWLETFMPAIRERVNNHLIGANLSDVDIVHLMELCPFETVASPDGHPSDFCTLFTKAEWKEYNYLQTLGKYYGYGDGNALGPTQGVGYVNELIARLTGSPVHDHTSSNTTMDNDPDLFPVGEQYALYADFSHDNDMFFVFSALNLFKDTAPPSNTTMQSPDEMDGLAASWVVPFAARAYVEKLWCGQDEEERVRIILNDRVMQLHGCDNDEYRTCRLDGFVDSLAFARKGGRWDECFG